jgi:hypothetical protein
MRAQRSGVQDEIAEKNEFEKFLQQASGSSKEMLASLFMADEMPLEDAAEMFPDVRTKSA